MFATSRITVLVTGTPLVDAAYFCAVAVLLYLVAAGRHTIAALSLPVLVLTKETFLLFLPVPLIVEPKRYRFYAAGLTCAVVVYLLSRRAIDAIYPGSPYPLSEMSIERLEDIPENFRKLFTLRGIHDLQNGFSLLLVIAGLGAVLNHKHRHYVIPKVVLASVPIGLGYALLVGRLGRMFFVAFPAVIAYALIAICYCSRYTKPDLSPKTVAKSE
jgi:hypothetical protein